MTPQFLDPFKGEQVGFAEGRTVWSTLMPLRYVWSRGRVLLVPAEFVTDLASVPRLPLTYLLAGGRGTRSAVIHDFAYQFGFWFLEGGARLLTDKATADCVFRESLLADPISGAGGGMAWMMYQAVRVGGRGHWSAESTRTQALNPEWHAAGWRQVQA